MRIDLSRVSPDPDGLALERRRIRSTPFEWEAWRNRVAALLPPHAHADYETWCWSAPTGIWVLSIETHHQRIVDAGGVARVWRGTRGWDKAHNRWSLVDPEVENIRGFLILVGALVPPRVNAGLCECTRNVDCPGPTHYGGCPRWQPTPTCDHAACCAEPGCREAVG